MIQKSFQDLIGPANHCHGCGPENIHGLQIKSFWQGEKAVCHFTPLPHHCAGATNIVNGGIIAALVDCHCVGFAMADAYRREGREVGSAPLIWYVTANLNISYLKPTPINETLELLASIVSVEGRKTKIACSLTASIGECVKAEVLAVNIKRA